ncbi:sugar transferase [Bacteroides sp. UBA939]|uniref:sugar transferase n=1 Tax=Bacteroides sp. UBA939 TaxID=1946092 RepID=UPI0025B9CF65|nr:sugar transferase [Bacteroides sp. UBA939]
MNIQYPLYDFPLRRKGNRIFKRMLDVMMALVVLIVVYPLAYIIIGCCIKIKMPGRIIFSQKRNGRYGKVFTCYKFRSMLPNDQADTQQASDDDPRITPLGRLLRVTSLDELPQFWNVLKGDMSVIGPRPHMLIHTEQYCTVIPEYNKRLQVKPGITGWAQVHNLRGETDKPEKIRKRVEYDIWYIDHWSFMLDMKIVFGTLKVMLG